MTPDELASGALAVGASVLGVLWFAGWQRGHRWARPSTRHAVLGALTGLGAAILLGAVDELLRALGGSITSMPTRFASQAVVTWALAWIALQRPDSARADGDAPATLRDRGVEATLVWAWWLVLVGALGLVVAR